ncbi:B3/B4 domain-containing protein [Brevibacterium litoralis]|uniref:B3/B4 domain-containing protein n=1 Tax=Brevibacterium litoralis TaxID=3138935 RepID=UPI0032F0105D
MNTAHPRVTRLEDFLAGASVAPEVFAAHPDYRALLVAVDGLAPAASDAESEALLRAAEAHATGTLADTPVAEHPHVAAWRAAYKGFGAKPQKFRNSLEALLRRAAGDGLPRVNKLTDVYNAVCVTHGLPLGGEDLDAYAGSPHLVVATGDEDFDTAAAGSTVTDHPEPGEIVWRDDRAVTCRRWNWRQGVRTRLTEDTVRAVFILDALGPLDDEALRTAGDLLLAHLPAGPDGLAVATRLLAAEVPSPEGA